MLEKKRLSFLVVDDEKDLCWAIKKLFNVKDYIVDTVNTGEEAVKIAVDKPYPLIILDSKLPGIDGFEVARIIKKKHPKTSIIIFSGYHYREDKEIQEALRIGLFDDFISKPFDFDDIKTLISSKISIEQNI